MAGPAARPMAEMLVATPFRVPRMRRELAELVRRMVEQGKATSGACWYRASGSLVSSKLQWRHVANCDLPGSGSKATLRLNGSLIQMDEVLDEEGHAKSSKESSSKERDCPICQGLVLSMIHG